MLDQAVYWRIKWFWP